MNLTKNIGIRIKELAKLNGYSLQELALKSDVSLSTIKNFIYNKTNNPSTMVIYKICNTLNISLSEFFNSSLFL